MAGELPSPSKVKPQMACLGCRRVWEQGYARVGQPTRPQPSALLSRCPICGVGLFNAGRDFKAPPKSDLKQWRKVEALLRSGFQFTRYNRCKLPKYLNELPSFLREQHQMQEQALHQNQQARAGERARQKKVERKRARRVAQKKQMDAFIEGEARAARGSSPAGGASST